MVITLPKKTLRLWQMRVIAFCVTAVLALLGFGRGMAVFRILAIAVGAVSAVLVVWYLPCFYRSWRLEIGSHGIEVQKGVIIKTVHIMPQPRLICSGSYATPVGRLLGLCGVTLKAARKTLVLPELLKKDAEEIIK